MPRPEDIAWKFVVRLDGKRWRCPYCHKESSGSVTRVKSHFLKQPKEGIAYCTKVPEHIRTLMELLLNNEVHNKDDIAWKFVDRVEDSKWRCYYCSEYFFGDLTEVKGHLLGLPNEGTSICSGVPEHVRMLMQSFLDDIEQMVLELMMPDSGVNSDQQLQAERQFLESSAMPLLEQISHATIQTCESQQPSSHWLTGRDLDILPQSNQSQQSCDAVSDDLLRQHLSMDAFALLSLEPNHPPQLFDQSVQGNGQQHLSTSSSLPDEVAEEQSREAHGQSSMEPQLHDMLTQPSPVLTPESLECVRTLLPTPRGLSHMANFTPQSVIGLNSDQQSQAGHQFRQSSAMPLFVQSSHVQPALVSPQHQSVSHQFISPETRNAQQNPTGLLSSQKNHIVPCHPQAPMNMDPCILSSSQAPNNAPPRPQIQRRGIGLMGPSSLPELDMNKGVPLTSHTNIDNNFEKSSPLKRKIKRLYSREADIKDELKFAASLSLKKPRMEVKNWLADVENLRNDFHGIEATSENCLPPHQQVDVLMQEAEELIKQSKFPEGLFVVRETRVNKLLERKLVGKAFQRNTAEILEYLVEKHISRLGIYGMGGVGKTTIMVHIHNRLLEKENYGNVLWITVSQDFNIEKLQDNIWEALCLDIPQEKDVRKRAAMLSDCLTKIEKLTIILDDVWEHSDLEKVGIPIRANGLKLVITTRSFDVCGQMHCQEKIKIEPLSQEEAESLFFEELGSEVALNLEIKAVVKSIVKECAGLPIGVITMARSMRGVTDVFEWRDSLVKLEESSKGQTDMEKKVLMNLKFSYDRLDNPNVQQCFLSCALYPEDELIDKFELVEFFIDQGLIGGLHTRRKQYDRGLTILKKLGNVCLLEDHGSKMKMHDLIRDMALHIMSATSIVKAGKWLESIPSEEYWTDALEKVSLMGSEISEIPLNMSPNCPKLSTLLLNGSLLGDVVLPNSFFKQLCGLKVLNLSRCEPTELPNSISDLVNLSALLLEGCRELCRIPYLGKLTSLRKLNLSSCDKLEEVPEGLEMLVNLRYLDLRFSSIVELPEGVLGGLLNLQHLKVDFLDGQDMTKLRALETLECSFEDEDSFNMCVTVIEQSNPRCYYYLCMGQKDTSYSSDEEEGDITQIKNPERKVNIFGWDHAIVSYLCMVQKDTSYDEEESDITQIENPERKVNILGWDHDIVSVGGELTSFFILIPQDVQKMTMICCNDITNLSSMGPLKYLEELDIKECENLGAPCGEQDEEVTDILGPAPAPPLFPNLRVLGIFECPKVKYLFGHGSKSNLPHLRKIVISLCEEMVGIIAAVTSPPPHSLPLFPCLEEIYVEHCYKMKRAVEFEWMPHFPTLRRIEVWFCEMEEIIGAPPPSLSVEDISLESLRLHRCDNMRKLFPNEWLLHLPNLQSIEVHSCKIMVEMISGVGQGQEGSITTPVNNTPSSFQPPPLPKLKSLELYNLPELKSICEVPIRCDSMKRLNVYGCPELKRIPLQLRLPEIEELPYIRLEDEESWKTLMWDHPDAQAILQPYLRKGRQLNYPNAIELLAKGKGLL